MNNVAVQLNGVDFYKVSNDDMVLIMQQLWADELKNMPEVESYIDAIDPYVCTRIELIEAMRMALSYGSKSVALAMHEILVFRLTAAAITGNTFF